MQSAEKWRNAAIFASQTVAQRDTGGRCGGVPGGGGQGRDHPLAARPRSPGARFFHLLAAPPRPQQRSVSLPGARVVAGQFGDAVARRHDLALARVGQSRACPFDLHALAPVPQKVLRRGPDDAVSLGWLWEHWGTTQALRHVTTDPATSQDRQHNPAGENGFRLSFWSADWSPYRGLAQIAAGFPALRFALRPEYDPP